MENLRIDMKETDDTIASAKATAEFDKLVRKIRPELHKYCSHMVGSVIDGEDVLQDALTRAYQSLHVLADTDDIQRWLFRIAHNKAIDTLRTYENRYVSRLTDSDPLSIEDKPLENKDIVSMAMQLFLELTPKQRGCVLLKDVMSYSLSEIANILEMNVASVKAALHRGRIRLRTLSKTSRRNRKSISDTDVSPFLKEYIACFNARDFDALRSMLAEDVRCDLVGVAQFNGSNEVNSYYGNYNAKDDWRLACGSVETRPAILVYDPTSESRKAVYFMLVEEKNSKICSIRDFRYARYAMQYAEILEE